MVQSVFPFLVILTTFILVTTSQYNHRRPSRPVIDSGNNNYRPPYGTSSNGLKELELFYEWRELEFEFPTRMDQMYALNRGLYVVGNSVPIDVAVHYNASGSCRVFVTIPRFTTGIPMTLATVTNTRNGEPKLKPYPNYSAHSSHGTDCNGITSVFRVAIDECNRMWVLDTGRIGTIQYCAPQLLVFDLRTDVLIHRYRFPQSQYKSGVSLFVTPIVDVRDPPPAGRCMNAKVYIADVTGYGLVVYDTIKNTSWRVQNKLMYAYPDYGTFTIAGESFDLMDGILGMDVSPKNYPGDRQLFFHSLASGVESVVSLSVLDNQTLWDHDTEANPRAFRTIGERSIQSAAEAMDSKGNLFFGVMNPIAIAYWNINTPYNTNTIKVISYNNKTLQFASGVKIVKDRYGKDELWVSTCRFQKIMAGTKNSNEINFRIQRCYVDDLLSNSANSCGSGMCSSSKHNLIQNDIADETSASSNLIFN